MEFEHTFLLIVILLFVLQVYAISKFIVVKESPVGKNYTNMVKTFNAVFLSFKDYEQALNIWNNRFKGTKGVFLYGYINYYEPNGTLSTRTTYTGYAAKTKNHGIVIFGRITVNYYVIKRMTIYSSYFFKNNVSYFCGRFSDKNASNCTNTTRFSFLNIAPKYIRQDFIFTYTVCKILKRYKHYPNGTIELIIENMGKAHFRIFIQKRSAVWIMKTPGFVMVMNMERNDSIRPDYIEKEWNKSLTMYLEKYHAKYRSFNNVNFVWLTMVPLVYGQVLVELPEKSQHMLPIGIEFRLIKKL